jgi:branched-chain amino acid aminotransferase
VRPLEELREAGAAVLEANGWTAARTRIRITVTGGPAPLGSERGEAGETTLVAASLLEPAGVSADVAVVPFTRNETGALAGLKTTSYGENVVALAYAKRRGAHEAIFANTKGSLCEGTGTNVFLVTEDGLVTPSLAAGCLAGVTRGLVLELCAQEEIAVVEKLVSIDALHQTAEAFLTGTTREVQPIRKVDDRELRLVPGEITGRLRAAFRALADGNLDP